MPNLNPILLLLLISIVVSLIITRFSIALTTKFGFMDNPNIERHKTHPNPVPLAGGLSLILSLGIVTLLFRQPLSAFFNQYLVIGLIILFLTGILDDRLIFTPAKKLFGQIVGAIFIIIGGIHTFIFNGTFLDWLITIVWLVGIVNAFNFLDGSDGMILETSMIILGALVVFTQLSSQRELQLVVVALLGIIIGLLYFNVRPAKMFMGDSGSQTLGLLLAILTLQYNPLGHDHLSSWITPIIMMSIPIFDVTLVVYSRTRRHLPIYRSGLDHTYHRLLQRGLSPKNATASLIFLVLLSNFIAFGALKANRYIAYGALATLILTGIFLIYLLDHKYQPRD